MFNFLKSLLGGTKSERELKEFVPVVDKINAEFEKLRSVSNDELRHKTTEFRKRIQDYVAEIQTDIAQMQEKAISTNDVEEKEDLFEKIDALVKEKDEAYEEILKQILPEAFAVVKATAKRLSENETLEVTATDHDRMLAGQGKDYVSIEGDQAIWKNNWLAAGSRITWNMVHYDVQLIGGMVLHSGKIAEMATGEGKTLVSTLPSYLNGLTGEGVHVITVNDYLARRDAEWNGPLFEFLLLTVDCIDKYKSHSDERKTAYTRDIVYGTNNEFGFDYLRDNMVRETSEMKQRKHHYAMVDEVDSVLIDDARTPLIISGPVGHSTDDQDYIELNPMVQRLLQEQQRNATQYLASAKKLFSDGIVGVEEGEAGLALLRAQRSLPKNRPLIKFMSEEGVKVLFQKTENHYMQEQSKRMKLVDEPLYFTIEEKNRDIQLTRKGADYLAKITGDPEFFSIPNMAETLIQIDENTDWTKEEKILKKEQLSLEFAVKSKRLHAISQLLKAYALFEKDEEYIVIDGEVKIVDEQTGRIMEGRRYSDGLHQALEAKENVKVGEITQTYATITLQNYFRMYHKLCGMTGTAETEAGEFWEIYKLDVSTVPTNRPMTRKDMEDLVYKTAREKFNAVIDEIVQLTEAKRPVLVGTTSVDISERLSRMLQMRGIDHNVLNAKQHAREAEIVAEAGLPGKVTIATNMAGRGTDIKISDEVKKAGGLAIVGTERHDSRRVDRQLRGRAGRQGDPGTSQFFVSLEDNLMRLFQSERIAGMMDKMGHKDGEVIQHSMVTKSIERAQKKVEENNFGIRKRLLEYDNVMNIQREAIYKKRKNALSGERLIIDLNQMFTSLTDNLVTNHKENGDYDSFRLASLTIFGMDPDIDQSTFESSKTDALIEQFQQQAQVFYNDKRNKIAETLYPFIKDVHEKEGHRYSRILVPFTDGSTHPLPVSADLKKAYDSKGRSIMSDLEQTITLAIIDEEWKEHLRSMDDLKDSTQGASFEQKDPLVIYKIEAFQLFKQFINIINEKVISYLYKGIVLIREEEQVRQAPTPPKLNPQQLRNNRFQEQEKMQRQAIESSGNSGDEERKKAPIIKDPKIGRNDPCPCGSGKKFKNCHGS
ncbi:MAG: preprotein translocase subunit SecA [Saprospiraceae bacterium]